jgi:hypothetical protein
MTALAKRQIGFLLRQSSRRNLCANPLLKLKLELKIRGRPSRRLFMAFSLICTVALIPMNQDKTTIGSKTNGLTDTATRLKVIEPVSLATIPAISLIVCVAGSGIRSLCHHSSHLRYTLHRLRSRVHSTTLYDVAFSRTILLLASCNMTVVSIIFHCSALSATRSQRGNTEMRISLAKFNYSVYQLKPPHFYKM